MLADRILLQQVILNLVRNAVEAMTGTAERPKSRHDRDLGKTSATGPGSACATWGVGISAR